MRQKVLLIFIIVPWFLFSQQKWTMQTDSIYKSNRIKTLKKFKDKKLISVINFNNQGEIIKEKGGAYVENFGALYGTSLPSGGYHIYHYKYDEKGNVLQKIDSTKFVSLNNSSFKKFSKIINDIEKIEIAFLKYEKTNKIKCNVDITHYKNEYLNNELLKVKQFNHEKELQKVIKFENKGKKQLIVEYRNNNVFNQKTDEYSEEFNLIKSYGWQLISASEKRNFNSTFEYKIKASKIKKVKSYFNQKIMKKYDLKYNENGLIEQLNRITISSNQIETLDYEYEFY